MPVFGPRSEENLSQAHPALQTVMRAAIARTKQDFTVICGHRDKAGQEAAFRAKNTKVRYPNSAHNQTPSCAVDVIPYPFKGWNDKNIHKELKAIADVVLAVAKELNIPVRWGADWNRNGRTDDETFVDSPHFELHPWRDFAAKRAA